MALESRRRTTSGSLGCSNASALLTKGRALVWQSCAKMWNASVGTLVSSPPLGRGANSGSSLNESKVGSVLRHCSSEIRAKAFEKLDIKVYFATGVNERQGSTWKTSTENSPEAST